MQNNQNTLRKSKSANFVTIGMLILILWIAGCSENLFSQNVTQDENGNFKAISRKSEDSTATKTNYTYTDNKGEVFPVFVTVKGKKFVWRTSKKTGKTYSYQLKLEATKQD